MRGPGHTVTPETTEPRLDGTLAGMRPEDLTHDERRALLRVFAQQQDNTTRAATLALARSIGQLRSPPSDLHPADVLALLQQRERQRMNRRWTLGAMGALMAVTTLIATLVLWPSASWTPGSLQLEAHTTHHGVRRAVGHGAQLKTDTMLELSAAASGPGTLFVVERWGYDAVRVLVAGDTARAGPRTVQIERRSPGHAAVFEAWLCPPRAASWGPDTCERSQLRLDWH